MARITYREAIAQALRKRCTATNECLSWRRSWVWAAPMPSRAAFSTSLAISVCATPPLPKGHRRRGGRRGDGGLRPVAELMTINFAFLALDQIVNNVAKMHYMFNARSLAPSSSAPSAAAGGSWEQPLADPGRDFCPLPGLKVVAPGTPADAKGCSSRPFGTTTRSSSSSTPRSTRCAARCPTTTIFWCPSAFPTSSGKART